MTCFRGRIPQMRFQYDAPILVERHSLGAQAFLHDMRPPETHPAGQCAKPVDDTVARKHGARRRAQCPADRAGSGTHTEIAGNMPVGRNFTARDPVHYGPDPFEEIIVPGGVQTPYTALPVLCCCIPAEPAEL